MLKKFIASLLAIVLVWTILPTSSHADELDGLTLEKEMREMIKRGIIKGYTDGKVYPKAEVRRSDFAAFLARTLKLQNEIPNFVDVNKSAAVAGEIGAIQKTGFMTGTLDGKFMPDKIITREEMALTMSRVLEAHNYTRTGQDIIIEDNKSFTLNGGIAAAQWLASIELMKGGAGTQGAKSFIFKPKDRSLRDQVAAVLYRFIQLEENMTTPEPPKPPVEPEQPNNPEAFKVASIQNGKVVETSAQYKTYDEALKVLSSSNDLRVILKNKDIIKMKTGLAFAAATPGNTTLVYEDPAFKQQFTYVQKGREMKHRGSGPDYAIIEIGGRTGYVKHSEVDLVPKELVTGRDSYKSQNGLLYHATYNNLSKSYGTYVTGPAPDRLVPNRDYYSYDGVRFTDEAGRIQATEFQYFQFLSARVASVYTAQQLDAVIQQLLTERQATGASRYANATTKSKLVGLGSKLKTLEGQHRVNALFMLAAAIHESDFGVSEKAMTCNNLFGIKAYDSSTKVCETKFAKPEDSVNSFVGDYMNKNYLNPLGAYANGAVSGNKSVGANVRYASDPDWGAKIAGHLYTLDSKLGGKEYKRLTLGRINYYNKNNGVNVRTSPGVTNSNLLFTYKPKPLGEGDLFGYPVVIVDEVTAADGQKWYKIVNDMNPVHNGKPTPEFGYVLSELITVSSDKK